MQLHLLDFDGGVAAQRQLLADFQPAIHRLQAWGPRVRMGCRFGKFAALRKTLAGFLGAGAAAPAGYLLGSGDFHHVTLALLQRLEQPFNLLVLDKHPDWMRGIPVMHCGTWLYHALKLPALQRVFHVGGDLDFDNGFRWLAPWRQLRSGKIRVFPARRQFTGWPWSKLPNQAVRPSAGQPASAERIAQLIEPDRADLARYPLYISIDKDVLIAADAVVNWDSGYLTLGEARSVLDVFLEAASGRLAGFDLLGDWSPVAMRGLLRHGLHWTEHPQLKVTPTESRRVNEHANAQLLGALASSARLSLAGRAKTKPLAA